MFHTYVASVCHKCFICFKCMLYLSVSSCKCRLLALVSIRVGRAKPWPPMRGGGVGRRRACGEEAQGARWCYGRGGGESSEQRGQWDLKRAVQMRAQKTELMRATRESEWTEWSSLGCPNERRCPDGRRRSGASVDRRHAARSNNLWNGF